MKNVIKLFIGIFFFFSIALAASTAKAIFAGGCFWCVQADFDKLPGVTKTIVGYTGGKIKNPTYEQVSKEKTGHVEAVEVFYDPNKVSYKELLQHYWKNVDPFDAKGQFCDKGESYKAVIFYRSRSQRRAAQASVKEYEKQFKDKVTVEVKKAQKFYPAEDYHQEYYKKNPWRYKFYRYTCGRDKRLKQVWGDKNQNQS